MSLTLDGTTGISATGNIYGNNVIVTGTLSAGSFSPATFSITGNVTGGNILTGGVLSATANIIGGNILTGGLISATGNVLTTANISANYLLGNAYFVTGLSPTQIYSGTSNVTVTGSGANISVGIGGTANVAVFATTGEYVTGVISASGNITTGGQLVSSIATGTAPLAVTSTTLVPNLYASRANVSDYDIVTTATTGTYYPALFNAVTGNVQNYANSALNFNAATGALSASSLTVSTGTVTLGNIVNANGNAVGNIGSSSAYFNTIFGKATTAQYADLAELYVADAEYAPGTVVDFGGEQEITLSTQSSSARIAGIVSTNPAHLMNSTLTAEHVVAVALTGRVPTLVTGTVCKGDMMVSAGNGHAQACSIPAMGTVLGKAVANFEGASGTIEIVVGRL